MTLARTLQVLTLFTSLVGVVSAQASWPPANSHGPAPGLGYSIDILGDVDGDGFNDLIVGEPGDHLTTGPIVGRVVVYSGASASVIHSLTGPGGTRFGSHVADVGDVDGDGAADFAIGEGQIEHDTTTPATGRLVIYSGATGSPLYQLSGPDHLIVDVARVGDVDGDGGTDYAVGRPTVFFGAGRVDLISGASGTILRTWNGVFGDQLGTAVAAIDDLDGDSIPDLAIGKPWTGAVPSTTGLTSGAVDFVSSSTGALIRTVNTPGAAAYGGAIERIRDLDGDGVDDVVIGAAGVATIVAIGVGSVHVVSGATGAPILAISPPDAMPGLGSAIAIADFDLDGVDDIVFSSPNRDLQKGRVYVHSGATGNQEAVLDGTDAFSRFGFRLAAGDLNGDGMSELCISERFRGGALQSQGGFVTIHSAPSPYLPSGTTTVSATLLAQSTSTTAFAARGEAVASLGDVNGDGVDDIAIGEPGNHVYQSAFIGRVDIVSGADATTIRTLAGAVGEDYGKVIAAIGDVDGDGVSDAAIGVRAEIVTAGASPRVELRSGASGAVISSLPMSSSPTWICGPGDLDGDGTPDLVVGLIDLVSSVGAVSAFDSAGGLLWTFSTANPDRLGDTVVALDDMDGDGVAEVAVSAPTAANGFGEIMILSGATGSSVMTIPGPGAFSSFGESMATIDDLDGDGKLDIIVGVSTFLIFGGSPRVEVRSSANGAVLYSVPDPLGSGAFGSKIVSLDDIDGDGIREFAVNSGFKVAVFSGNDGTLGALIELPPGTSNPASAMAMAGDLDGDGARDLVVGAHQNSPGSPTSFSGSVYHFALDPIVVNPVQGGAPISGGVLAAEAAGNVGVGQGGPYAVLAVNDESGGFDRVVEVGIGQPIVFQMRQAPSLATPQRFAIFGLIGIPHPSDRLVIPTVGTLLFPPAPADPGAPWLFTLAESYLQPSIGFLPASPGDWDFLVPDGLPFATGFTLQAICDVSTGGGTGTSNALVVRVE